MNRFPRFLLPVFVLAVLALSLVGVAFARELNANDPRPAAGDDSISNEVEFYGAVEAIDGPTWTVAGVAFTVSPQTEIKGALVEGSFVKVHASLNAAGVLAAREIEAALPGRTGMDDNSNDDGPGHHVGDDHGNGNSNDDGPAHDVGDGNSNDDDASDDNGNSNDDGDDDWDSESGRGGKSGRGG